jgi:protein gp37
MAENSNISWTTHTFNPFRGCTRVSKGCQNCYAETLSKRNPKTMGVWGQQGTRVVASEAMWREPLKWDRKAKAEGVRHRVFCASLADVFEDWTGPMVDSNGNKLLVTLDGKFTTDGDDNYPRPATMQDARRRLFNLIDRTPNLDWLLLTKRPENILRMTYDAWCPPVPGHVSQNAGDGHAWKYPPNVWIGTSVEDQQTADFRIPHLLRVPAKVRFLSMEPLIGPVNLNEGSWFFPFGKQSPIHWVITGGESGDGFRDCDPKWQADIVEQCKGAGVAVFVKQDSGRLPGKQGRIPLAVWHHKEFPDCSPQNKPFTTEQGEQ